MTKEARIKKLGDTLEKIEDAIAKADFSTVDPAKLLDFKLKYTEALKGEYIGTKPAASWGQTSTHKTLLPLWAICLTVFVPVK